jgi:hypothetical protein
VAGSGADNGVQDALAVARAVATAVLPAPRRRERMAAQLRPKAVPSEVEVAACRRGGTPASSAA